MQTDGASVQCNCDPAKSDRPAQCWFDETARLLCSLKSVLLLLVPLATMVACNQNAGPARAVIAGAVTYKGESVALGEVRFIPKSGSTGPVATARIVDGKYRADAQGGVPVAKLKVELFAYRSDPKYEGQTQRPPNSPTFLDWPPKVQYLPTKYNTQSELEIVVEAGSGDICKDFRLD